MDTVDGLQDIDVLSTSLYETSPEESDHDKSQQTSGNNMKNMKNAGISGWLIAGMLLFGIIWIFSPLLSVSRSQRF
jgi:hypothetical protein